MVSYFISFLTPMRRPISTTPLVLPVKGKITLIYLLSEEMTATEIKTTVATRDADCTKVSSMYVTKPTCETPVGLFRPELNSTRAHLAASSFRREFISTRAHLNSNLLNINENKVV
ncbi:hypothetical protein FQR65_LT09234 [Abscondita terminalis]|nr:hypothetical protein FQR65_LT09234 [Abscondita terminalis]